MVYQPKTKTTRELEIFLLHVKLTESWERELNKSIQKQKLHMNLFVSFEKWGSPQHLRGYASWSERTAPTLFLKFEGFSWTTGEDGPYSAWERQNDDRNKMKPANDKDCDLYIPAFYPLTNGESTGSRDWSDSRSVGGSSQLEKKPREAAAEEGAAAATAAAAAEDSHAVAVHQGYVC